MKFAHAYVSHLGPDCVEAGLENLRRLFPEIPRILCHAGKREDFERIRFSPKIHVEDPTFPEWQARMREGLPYLCFADLLPGLLSVLEEHHPGTTHLHVSEYDHLIADPLYFEQLTAPWKSGNPGLVAKACRDTTGTNWLHALRYRNDPGLLAYLESFSRREDRTRIFGMMFDGFTITMPALRELLALPGKPPVMCELLIPTLVHHLGFDVGEMACWSGLFRHVRWGPPWSPAAAEAILATASCCHPQKDVSLHAGIIARVRATRERPR